MIRLLHVGYGKRYDVDRPRDIGRADESSIQVLDMKVSRTHCRVEPDGDGLLLVDLGSVNGTFVNGHRASTCRVVPGDEVCVGRSRFLVRGDER